MSHWTRNYHQAFFIIWATLGHVRRCLWNMHFSLFTFSYRFWKLRTLCQWNGQDYCKIVLNILIDYIMIQISREVQYGGKIGNLTRSNSITKYLLYKLPAFVTTDHVTIIMKVSTNTASYTIFHNFFSYRNQGSWSWCCCNLFFHLDHSIDFQRRYWPGW